MRKRRVWRYYCDFCKKANCSSYAISQHELHCTMNPNRSCRMCKWQRNNKLTITEMKEALAISLNRLRFLVQCPACILATIRQSGESPYGKYDFEYGKEAETYWAKVREQWEKEQAEAVLYQ